MKWNWIFPWVPLPSDWSPAIFISMAWLIYKSGWRAAATAMKHVSRGIRALALEYYTQCNILYIHTCRQLYSSSNGGTTVVRHVFHLRQLLLLLLLAGWWWEPHTKIQKHRGDRWMDGWLAGRAKYLASQCLKDGRLYTTLYSYLMGTFLCIVYRGGLCDYVSESFRFCCCYFSFLLW